MCVSTYIFIDTLTHPYMYMHITTYMDMHIHTHTYTYIGHLYSHTHIIKCYRILTKFQEWQENQREGFRKHTVRIMSNWDKPIP